MNLIVKIDQFIRKYYKNQVVKGLMYSVGLIFALWLSIILLEYFGELGSLGRTLLIAGFSLGSLYTLIRWVLIPLLKMFRLGKVLSYEQASVIIGDHFPEVQDKLLNALQLLKSASADQGKENALLHAAIDQKTDELKPFTFTKAIDLSKNRVYLKYAIPPVLIIAAMLIFSPSVVLDSTHRLVHFSEEFIPKAPFQFELLNKNLRLVQGQDYTLKVRLVGKLRPDAVYLEFEGSKFRMDEASNGEFVYKLQGLQSNLNFTFFAGGFYSSEYQLVVLSKPSVSRLQIALTFPKYLNRPDELIENTGDLNIPEGTLALWNISSKHSDSVRFEFGGKSVSIPSPEGLCQFKRRLLDSEDYSLTLSSKKGLIGEVLQFHVSVVKDQYPHIRSEQIQDSILLNTIHFSIEYGDDYGISKLRMICVNKSNGQINTREIAVGAGSLNGRSYFSLNTDEIGLNEAEVLEYYFEVFDNDGVNGPKSSKTSVMSFKVPSKDELQSLLEEKNQNINKELSESIKEAKQIQKELEKIRRDVLSGKNLDWKERKKIQELLAREKDLEKRLNEVQQENKLKELQEDAFKSTKSEDLLEKQKQIDELFENLMSEEMKDLFRQMSELLDKQDQEKLLEKMQDLQLNNQDLEKELDRTLSLYKQLEFEKKMEQTINELKEISKEQKELSKTESLSQAEELKKQSELNDAFKRLQEKLKELKNQSEELNNGMSPEKTKETQQSIAEQQQKASEQIKSKQGQKANESQEKAAEKMEQMAQDMEQMMQEEQEEQQGEDINAIRQILDNLIHLSLDQEQLMKSLSKTSKIDPNYVRLTQDQKRFKDDAKIIQDSLFALSKRVPQLQSIVNKEISAINRNMSQSIEHMAERESNQAIVNQQYSMTALNNLALILDASLKQMQEQMKNQKSGSANCKKPGKGQKPSPGNLSKMQEQISKQLDELKKKMDQGKSPEGQKKGNQGNEGLSEQLAKMAAQQAAIRRQLEKLAQELNKEGKGAGNKLRDLAKDMEETERDIVNKNIKPETLRRQQNIMTRLLEHEKAERERDQENRRESESPKTYPLSNPEDYFNYNRKKMISGDMLKTVPIGLKPYYKVKSEKYLNYDKLPSN